MGRQARTLHYSLADVSGTGGTVSFSPQLSAAKCLDVSGSNTASGTPVILWDCTYTPNQVFTWTTAGELRFNGVCVTANGTTPGSLVVVSACNGSAAQHWTGTTSARVVGLNGMCLDVPSGNTANLTQMSVWTCLGGTDQNQAWNYRTSSTTSTSGAWSQAPTSPTVWSYTTYPVPAGAIALRPGDNWQAKVDAAGAGAPFVVAAGAYHGVAVAPLSTQTFIGQPGSVLDGDGATPVAFDTRSRPSSGVAVRGLTFQNYATGSGLGTIDGDNATGWTVEGNEIRYANGTGLRVGPSMRLLNNFVHHSSYAGIGGYRAQGALLEANEVSYNNTSGVSPDNATGGAAGIKVFATDNATLRRNYVHHNDGVGLWCDGGCYGTTIEYNTVSDNYYRGIFYEISYNAVIRYNTAERNQTTYSDGWPAGGGIVASASPNVEVYGNVVRDNGDGIFGYQAENRGSGAHGAYVLSSFYVHDNLVRMPRGQTGVGQLVGDDSYFTSRNNRFANNSYTLTGNATPFIWMDGTRTDPQWKGYGEDVSGTFIR